MVSINALQVCWIENQLPSNSGKDQDEKHEFSYLQTNGSGGTIVMRSQLWWTLKQLEGLMQKLSTYFPIRDSRLHVVTSL